ncbi:MAG: TldD/PmbA family protein [Deltaproteobacteria bacterium]|nr:TldD/PmbA family protein [Deltaproteobacteria bacterium]
MSEKTNNINLNRRTFLGASVASLAAVSGLASGCRKDSKTVAKKEIMSNNIFEVSDETIRKVMTKALSTGGDYADLFFQKKKRIWLGLEDSIVSRAYTSIEMGVGIRVIKGEQTGYAYTESLDEKSMLQAATVASSAATGTGKLKNTSFKVVPDRKTFYPDKPVWENISISSRKNILDKINSDCRKRDKRIINVKTWIQDEESYVTLYTSEGNVFYDYSPMTTAGVNCVAENGKDRESNGLNISQKSGIDFYSQSKIDEITKNAVERTVKLFDCVSGPVGELPLVMAPGSSGILLHEAIGHGMEADFARNKTTIYTDRIGKKIADENVTVVDDGRLDSMRGSINHDDEGADSQRTVLVEKGIFRTFMHDRISSTYFKNPQTGNGRRESYKFMPIPRMRNTYMTNGPHKPEEIIQSVKKGIYAESFTNGQVAIGAGDFTFYVKTGYLIENGKLTSPIKDLNIIGNGPRVLENITMVGDDFQLHDGGWTCGKAGQGVPVGLGMPTCLVKSITCGGNK